MTNKEEMEFEILIGDMCEREEIESAKDLERFADDLHNIIENALRDYVLDHDIEDYEPCY
jgi:hypothetical protein